MVRPSTRDTTPTTRQEGHHASGTAQPLSSVDAGARRPTPDQQNAGGTSTLAFKNGLWSSLASLVGAAAGLIGSVVIVRGLTPEEYGAFSYYLWLSSIVSTLGTLALPQSLTKIRSELRGEQNSEQAGAVSNAVIATLIAINGTLAFVFALRAWGADAPDRTYQFIIALALVPIGLTSALRSHFWADQRYRPVAIMSLLGTAANLGLIAATTWFEWHVAGYLTAALSLNAVQCFGLLAVISLRRRTVSLPRLRLPARSIVARFAVFAAPSALVQLTDQLIWQRSGVFFLERESTLEQVGHYSLAYTGFSLLLMLGWSLVQGYYPAISHDFGAGDWDGIRRRLRQAAILATLYAAPVSLGGVAMLPYLLPLVYGAKAEPSVPVAQLLFLGLLPGVVTSVVGLTISAVGGIWLHVRIGIISAAVSVVSNLILVPRLGAVGSAIANTIAQLTTAMLLTVCAYVMFRLTLPWRRVALISVAGALCAFVLPTVIHELVPDTVGVGIAVAAAALLYAATAWRLGFVRMFFGVHKATA